MFKCLVSFHFYTVYLKSNQFSVRILKKFISNHNITVSIKLNLSRTKLKCKLSYPNYGSNKSSKTYFNFKIKLCSKSKTLVKHINSKMSKIKNMLTLKAFEKNGFQKPQILNLKQKILNGHHVIDVIDSSFDNSYQVIIIAILINNLS
ncbi:hypothetical protein BpHYR1_014357 [Brachionus plicatilis]|uniref:Uncharacterized protein n=1 Tax=Brachionus plicatilis TaxID=10195 RepID=A0A3M7QH70_BRAPC|nr:hypothetical protein BpHYR1_014357 [Brachionus plicatilis]